MIIGGNFFLIGAIVMAVAVNTGMLIFGRVMLGLGVGVSVQSGPLFLSELAPYHLRGLFNTLFQVNFGLTVPHVYHSNVLYAPIQKHCQPAAAQYCSIKHHYLLNPTLPDASLLCYASVCRITHHSLSFTVILQHTLHCLL